MLLANQTNPKPGHAELLDNQQYRHSFHHVRPYVACPHHHHQQPTNGQRRRDADLSAHSSQCAVSNSFDVRVYPLDVVAHPLHPHATKGQNVSALDSTTADLIK